MDPSPLVRERQSDSDKLLAEWVLQDRLPFAIVESESMRAWVHSLNQNYRLMCRQTLKKKVDSLGIISHSNISSPAQVISSFSEQELLIRRYFKERPGLRPCCMLDLWKSIAGEHYLGIALSFIDEDWTMWAIALAVRPILESHTSTKT